MHLKSICAAVAATVALIGCGGGDDGPRYSALVSFGDSLSDVGSYRTPGIAALGGGKYTVNGAADGVWIEQLAKDLKLPAPCAAQTGLEATGIFAALAGAVANVAGCTAYGQGGSRVTDPIGPWNKGLLAVPTQQAQFTGQLGQLTSPVVDQVARHLAANGGSFSGKELVTVLAGANDVFVNTDEVAAGAKTPTEAVTALAMAGGELAQLIRTQIVGKGAKQVVVLNLPRIGNTPASVAGGAAAQQLVDGMTQAFNAALKAGLAGAEGVREIDFYEENSMHAITPAAFGLTNVSQPACVNTFPQAPSFPAPSLTCTTATAVPGVDVSRYLFADTVHPTPYGHTLIRNMVLADLETAGWK